MRDYTEYQIKATRFKGQLHLGNQPFNPLDTTNSILFTSFLALVGLLFIGYYPIVGIIFILPIIIVGIIYYNGVEKNKAYKANLLVKENFRLKEEANKMTKSLIDLLIKSEELSSIGLSHQIESIEEILKVLKYEFSDGALIPFWDEVENFVKSIDSYENSLGILKNNSTLYYQYIHTTDNNFPKNFPIKIITQFPEHILREFELIKREAFKKFEFANLWEQRKTQKILVLGFSTLGEAINNMNFSITSAINDLNATVQSGFENLSFEIRESRIEQHNDFVYANNNIERNLKTIDDKLYYIQYNRRPIQPFGDISAPKR